MGSICLYTILFTLPDKDSNKYIDMFLIWVSCVVKNAGLGEDDMLVILIDVKSFEMLNQHTVNLLLSKLKCKYNFIACPPIKNMKEGMLMKYIPFEYTQNALMYLDIDILVLKDIHRDFEDKLYVHPEGRLTDDNYGASITKDKENQIGFSAGKFVVGSKGLRNVFFRIVSTNASENSEMYYSFDQPYFNEAILKISPQYIDFTTILPPFISTNLHKYDPEITVLVDYMGMPGDESFHWNKILSAFCLISCGKLE